MTNDEFQNLVLEELSKINSRVNSIESNMTTKHELADIKKEMGTKVQQDENNRFIQTLLHRTEELDAKFDGLLNTTTNKEVIERIETKLIF